MKWFKFNRHQPKQKEQKENQAEQIALHSTSRRFDNYWNRKGIKSFHHTTFSFCSSVTLLILMIFISNFIGSIVSGISRIMMHKSLKPILKLSSLSNLSYIITDVIPIILMIWLYNNRFEFKSWFIKFLRWRITHYHFQFGKTYYRMHADTFQKPKHWIWFKPYIRWIKNFYHDLIKHYKLIIELLIIVEATYVIMKLIFVPIAGPNLASPTTVTMLSKAKHNLFVLPIFIVIVPIAEELIYRVLLPNTISGIFNKLFRQGQFLMTKYVGASLLAAMIFAQRHEQTGANWGVAMAVFAFALVQQIIYKKSRSITLPVIIHMLANFIRIMIEI